MKKVMYLIMFSFVLLSCKKAAMAEPGSEPTYNDGKKNAVEKIQTVDRKLIKDGRIKFQTSDVEATDHTVRKVVKKFGAWIADDNCFRSDSKLEYNLTIRVPSERYDSLANAILENVEVQKLDSKTTSISDVTEEFIDVGARLKIKKESEQKLSEMLSKAANLTEILEIQKQLTDLRADIESVEGRMKFLTDQVTYSTLRVSFYTKMPYSQRFFGSFWNALKNGWEVFLYVLTFAAYLWVIILVVVLGRWGYKRYKQYKAEKNE